MKLWTVKKKSDCLLLNEYTGNHVGYEDFIYRATLRRAKEVFEVETSYRHVKANWGYDHGVEIPLNCTTREAERLRALVLADLEEEKRRISDVESALDGINAAVAELERVKKILSN